MSRTTEVALALAGFEAGIRGERPDPTEPADSPYHTHLQRGKEARVAMIQEAVGEAEALIDHRTEAADSPR